MKEELTYRETLGKSEGRAEGLSLSKITGLIIVYKMIQSEI